MGISLQPCSGLPSCCDPEKLFIGFNSDKPDNNECPKYYKYLAICDWDACLLDCDKAISGDSVQGFSSPNWGDSIPPCCSDPNQAPCCCSDCESDPPCEPSYKQNLVDGHRVYENNGDGTATCISATGYYSPYVGEIVNSCYLRSLVTGVGNSSSTDQIAYSCGLEIPSFCCPDSSINVLVGYLWNE